MRRMFMVVLLVCVFGCTANAFDGAFSLLGTSNDSYVASFGKVVKYKYEVGVHVMISDTSNPDDAYDMSVGPYIAGDIPVPQIIQLADYKVYGGLSGLWNLKQKEPVGRFFIAGLLYPDRDISPVLGVEYKQFEGDMQVKKRDDGLLWFGGLRIKF